MRIAVQMLRICAAPSHFFAPDGDNSPVFGASFPQFAADCHCLTCTALYVGFAVQMPL